MIWAWPLVGAVLGGVFVGTVRKRNDEAGRRRMSATGLVVAAAGYVGFAALAADPGGIARSIGGVVTFALLGRWGVRRRRIWLAVGWGGHVVWDVTLHLATPALAPAWYAILCLGFDPVVAVSEAHALRSGVSAGSTA